MIRNAVSDLTVKMRRASEYDEIVVRFPGTGDIFSAILVGDILNGKSLPDATSHSMEVVKKMIELNIDKADKYRGIPVEQYLELI